MDNVTRKITFAGESLPTISVSMIVKNEEETLGRLLSEISGVVDEIVVVDTGSTDKTIEIAEGYGATVYHFPWCEDFSAARNESIKHCTKDYILWLDADDMVSAQEISKLKHMIKERPDRAYFLTLVDRRPDKEYHSVQLRIFPNHKDLKFSGKVHEQISFCCEEKGIQYETLPVNVLHLGYSTEDTINKKLRRNLDILYEEAETEKNFLVYLNIAKSHIGMQEFGKATSFVDKALDMIRDNTANVSRENMYIAVLTKINLLAVKNDIHGIRSVLEEFKNQFMDLDIFRLSYGETLFILGKYADAYKMLYTAKNNKLNLGLIPLDYDAVLKSMNLLLLFSSLHIGDKYAAEDIIRKISKVENFTITEGWK